MFDEGDICDNSECAHCVALRLMREEVADAMRDAVEVSILFPNLSKEQTTAVLDARWRQRGTRSGV